MILLVLVAVALLGPLVYHALRLLAKAHLWAVALFLPAGLVIRYGPSQEVRVFVAVTIVWAGVLAVAVYRRRGQVGSAITA